MRLENIKKRQERVKKQEVRKRCENCNRWLRTGNTKEVCSYCQQKTYWKEHYKRQIEELERRIKLYDIEILDLMKRLKKYEKVSWEDEIAEDDR